MRTLKFILLPLFGVFAAIIAFRLAAPYEDTLSHGGMSSEDARALFTYGTKWGEVNRIAFGALLCGPFAVVLSLGRQSVTRVVWAGVLGAVIGGFFNFITDSSADVLGIVLAGRSPAFGSLMAMLAWCVLVPIGIAMTLVIAQGVTPQRIRRAIYAVRITAVASFAVQMIGGMMAVQDGNGEINLQSQIPVWRMVEIAVGLAFGVTILLADEWVRSGTIRLMHGRNEFVDWSLDYASNRIGSAEGSEIYIRGFQGVEPQHAVIVWQGDQFVLEAHGQTLVNGQPVSRVPLNSQDVVSIGDAQLVFYSNTALGYRQASFQQTGYQQIAYQQQPNVQQNPAQQAQANQTPVYLAPVPGYADTRILQDAFGHQISLVPGRYAVGRDQTNAICLYNDPNVSASHAEIIATATDLIVADLHSATGTRVNGRPISSPTSLRQGDVVEFGASKFSFIR